MTSTEDDQRMRVGVSLTSVAVDTPPDFTDSAHGSADSGLDHLQVGDHVSFRDGTGFDGMIHAAALLTAQDRLPVRVGLYLLALRHPVIAARQVADLARLFPGRFGLGVGVGGEDRHEFEVVGVDPATRGRRTDEALDLLRDLLHGGSVSRAGRYYPVRDAVVAPAPSVSVPIVIGGRSDAALRRVARVGDGWLGLWVSPERFAAATTEIAARAADLGRGRPAWRHGMSVWCAVPGPRGRGAADLAEAMERRYKLPFEKFARWCPIGPPDEVADFLRDYAGAGCGEVTLTFPVSGHHEAVQSAAEVRSHLAD